MQSSPLRSLLSNQKFIAIVYTIAALIACLLKIAIDLKPHDAINYISKINNFTIYRNSFYHLINQGTLYGYFPAEQYDEFLYSPTFAFLFAPFAMLPKYIGACLWCVFNALCVYFAISRLSLNHQKKTFIFWFVLIELLTAIQNVQVNPLVASLFLIAFISYEKESPLWASFFVVLSLYIKVFGILGASLFLIYPQRTKFIAYSIMWAVIFFALPLMVVSPQQLILLYNDWFMAMGADHAKNMVDVSVMRMLSAVSGITFSEQTRLLIQIGAIFLFCIKYIHLKHYSKTESRYFFLASAMIWCIIFNHAAESSTYIIAILGVALWYVNAEQNRWNIYLLILAFALCSLSPTDIFPAHIRKLYIVPMALKSLPCLLIYLKLEYDMIFKKVFVTLERH